jgi:hypothetical protein
MPHAWVWIESKKNNKSPWNSAVQTFAFEPCSSKTNQGISQAVGQNLGFLNLLPGEIMDTFMKIQLSREEH